MKRKAYVQTHRLGSLEQEILRLIALEEVSYEYLWSQTSTFAVYRFRSDLAAYRYRIKRAIKRLKERQYIEQCGETVTITNAGNRALTSAAIRNKELLSRKKWDGRWRICAFDIPEKHAALRNQVRYILKQSGFVRLQNSVWIFPHECEELVRLIKEESRLSKHILYGVLDRIEDDGILKKHFRL